MSNNSMKFSRRTVAMLWLLAASVLIGFLIYIEQIPVLYLLATVGLVVLLLIVAFADLENVELVDREQF